ncbi:MAG: hypothetical protein CM1200mP18_22230 [Gammaproteobacteria bacterium]|nr:MAG: hypothetical protein CM1200mP18_22230 [Gammaproteobacteria bacterium]
MSANQIRARTTLALSEQSIDLLINNAGIYGGERQSFGDIDYAQWTRVLEVNTLGPYRVSTALADPGETVNNV